MTTEPKAKIVRNVYLSGELRADFALLDYVPVIDDIGETPVIIAVVHDLELPAHGYAGNMSLYHAPPKGATGVIYFRLDNAEGMAIDEDIAFPAGSSLQITTLDILRSASKSGSLRLSIHRNLFEIDYGALRTVVQAFEDGGTLPPCYLE